MKQTVFICHSNPQDNEFTLWLASRLKVLGYDVWCDLKELLGGEKHWEVIYKVIKNESCKFLFVVSKSICVEPGVLKDGISKEFSLAETVAKSIDDFIIPLKIDRDSSYDSFIGQNRFNHISFVDSWADGLHQLTNKLMKDKVPTKELNYDLEKSWYFDPFVKKYNLIKKKESYYSNWWPLGELPENFVIYKYHNELQANDIVALNHRLTCILHGDSVAMMGFGETKLTYNTFSDISTIYPLDSFTIPIIDVVEGEYVSDTFPTTKDAENLLKRLLKRSFHLTMREKGLKWYELSNRQLCYFYPLSSQRWISFELNGKKKKKILVGEYKGSYWHYAVSCSVIFNPTPSFVLKGHIIFSDDGSNIWDDKDKLQTARRDKAKRFFNEAWRDLILAFIASLKNDSEEIKLIVDPGLKIFMIDKPLEINSEVGFIDPIDENRQSILSTDDEIDTEDDIKEDVNESE